MYVDLLNIYEKIYQSYIYFLLIMYLKGIVYKNNQPNSEDKMKLPIFKKKRMKTNKQYELENIPDHVAIIMDGNGRWAKKRGLPRIAGHKEGMDVVKEIVIAASNLNVEILTLRSEESRVGKEI